MDPQWLWKPVCAVDLRTALKSFCHWLIKHEWVILVAHYNGRRFDFPVIMIMKKTFMAIGEHAKFLELMMGLIDSLP